MIPRRLRLPPTRIEYLFKKGKRVVNDCLTLRYLPLTRQKKDACRFCVIISANLEPKAVKRNRLRRQIYEIIRLNRQIIPSNFDIIIIGKKSLTGLEYDQISANIITLLKKLR